MRLQFSHSKENDAQKIIFRLEVTLLSGPITNAFMRENPEPPSRTIEILGSQSLIDLHEIIFKAFDREDQHMFEFQVGGKKPMDKKATSYGMKMGDDFFEDMNSYDAGETPMASLNLSPGNTFFYWFDFGDDWWHVLKVLDITPLTESKKKFPCVVASFGASPPQYPDFEDFDDDDNLLNLDEVKQNPRFQEISSLLEAFTKEHLNQEYFEIAQDMLLELFGSDLELSRSKPESWAAGVMHAVGWVNFLGDPSSTLHMPLKSIAKHFGVSAGTMEAKSRNIRDELELVPLDPVFCTEENQEENPMHELESLETILHCIRDLSEDKQTQATQAKLLSLLRQSKKS